MDPSGEKIKRSFKFLPLTIRVDTLGGIATPLVLRGTPLPTKRTENFSTATDNQSVVEITFSLGESPISRNNFPLGSFKLQGIPSARRGVPVILVEFSVDSACTMTARGRLQGSTLEAEKKFDPPADLSDEFVSRVLVSVEETRTADDTMLRQVEAENRANSLIAKAEEKLASGSDAKLSNAVAALGLSLASGDSASIREKSDELDTLLSASANIFSDAGLSDFFGFLAAPAQSRTSTRSATRGSRTHKPGQVISSTQSHQLGKIFGGGTFTLDPQLCFVLMSFDEKFRPIYEDHIRPIVERLGLRCERADDITGTTLITWDIWEGINRARFLVAELTGRNANVFYELGLAHALSKDVILLTQSMDHVPFDLKPLRCICYEFTPRGMQRLEKDLSATLEALIKVG